MHWGREFGGIAIATDAIRVSRGTAISGEYIAGRVELHYDQKSVHALPGRRN